jgi:hypothetical protein
MVLAPRRAPKGALVVPLSLLVMILPKDLLKEACFLSNIRCIKCKKEKNGASPFNEGRRKMAHLMWAGPQMAINSHAFHLLKHTKRLRAREEMFEKKRESYFKEESTKNTNVVFF